VLWKQGSLDVTVRCRDDAYVATLVSAVPAADE
jgi:hypothetical protein